MLQYMRKTHGFSESALYVSLDDFYFTGKNLSEFIAMFVRNGGKYLFLDEVHRYPTWAVEVKNANDLYPELQIVFSGSSIIEIHKANADLSRRALIRELNGLSFRQFLGLKYNVSVPIFSIEDILSRANDVVAAFPLEIKPYTALRAYLKEGYYPFFTEGGGEIYIERINNVVRAVVENDLVFYKDLDAGHFRKIYQLLSILAASPPFKPNIQRLSERSGISRTTLLNYLHYLEAARLLSLLQHKDRGISLLQKPEKIYLDNPNLLFALGRDEGVNEGGLRETFVFSQLRQQLEVFAHDKADFETANGLVFEIGGKNKGSQQITGLSDAYIFSDNLDFAVGRKIPLWLVGLLY
jgi:predicted AAA+ superfamily ATPase